MKVNDAFRDAKPKTGAQFLGKRARASSLERGEQGLEIRWADAWAVVLNGNQNRFLAARDSDLDPGAGLAILNRILE